MRHLKLANINIFILYGLVIYAASTLIQNLVCVFLTVEALGGMTILKLTINLIIIILSCIAISLGKRFGLVLFFIWNIVVSIWDCLCPDLGKCDILVYDILAIILWIAMLFLRKDGISAWKYFFKRDADKRSVETKINYLNEPEITQLDNVKEVIITDVSSKCESSESINLVDNSKTNGVKRESIFHHSKRKFIWTSKSKKTALISSLIFTCMIGLLFLFTRNSKSDDYVYLEYNKGQCILHSDMNCSNITKGTRPIRVTEIRKYINSGSYIYYCPKCTDTEFIERLIGNTPVSRNVSTPTPSAEDDIYENSDDTEYTDYSSSDNTEDEGSTDDDGEQENEDDGTNEDDSYLDNLED